MVSIDRAWPSPEHIKKNCPGGPSPLASRLSKVFHNKHFYTIIELISIPSDDAMLFYIILPFLGGVKSGGSADPHWWADHCFYAKYGMWDIARIGIR